MFIIKNNNGLGVGSDCFLRTNYMRKYVNHLYFHKLDSNEKGSNCQLHFVQFSDITKVYSPLNEPCLEKT